MKRAFVGLFCAVIWAGAAAQNVEPPDVTPRERDLRADCIKRLTYDWPASEKVVSTMIERPAKDEMFNVSVNLGQSSDEPMAQSMKKRGVNNAGLCFFDEQGMYSMMWVQGEPWRVKRAARPSFRWQQMGNNRK